MNIHAKAILGVVLYLVAVAQSQTGARGAEEAIELVPVSPTTTNVLMGRSYSLASKLVHGTEAHLQWWVRRFNGSGYDQATVIGGETNLTLAVKHADDDQIGIYLLAATNSISAATNEFNVWILSPPYLNPDTLVGWEGLAGESFQLAKRLPVLPSKWFHDGAPMPDGWIGEGIVSAETEGLYWFTAQDGSTGEVFTSPRVMVKIKPVTELPDRFRAIYSSTNVDRATASWTPAMREDGAITFVNSSSVWRWTQGALQKIFDVNASLPGFTNGTWSIWTSTSDEGGSVDGLGVEVYNGGFSHKSGVVRVDADGTRFIGAQGLQIGPDPGAVATQFTSPVRAGGLTAFWASTSNYLSALKVYDGTKLTEWFNSVTGWPAEYADWVVSADEFDRPDLGFDGVRAAFVGDHKFRRLNGLFSVDAAGNVSPIIMRFDAIPGTPFTIQRVSAQQIVVRGGKILFLASIFENFSNTCLLEYDPQRPQPFRVIAMEGDVVGNDACIGRIYPKFDYLSDGSIVFNALTGEFKPEFDQPGIPGAYPSVGIFRYADGALTVEMNSRNRLGGTQLLYPFLKSAAGINYVFQGNGFWATTAPAGARPNIARLEVQSVAKGMNASWAGEGWLQSSDDMVRWQNIFSGSGIITNDFASRARFIRVFFP